jgi:hypothetical protein
MSDATDRAVECPLLDPERTCGTPPSGDFSPSSPSISELRLDHRRLSLPIMRNAFRDKVGAAGSGRLPRFPSSL